MKQDKRRKMTKRVVDKDKVGVGGRRIKEKTVPSLSSIKRSLSRQINIQQVVKNNPVIEIKDGVAINMDYTNLQHLKWIQD